MLDLAQRLETELGKPIVAGDLALYLRVLTQIGVQGPITGHGRLLASIGSLGKAHNERR